MQDQRYSGVLAIFTREKTYRRSHELNLSASQVHEMQEEFWALTNLHELAFVYGIIKNFLPSFLKLFQSLKEFGMLNEESLS